MNGAPDQQAEEQEANALTTARPLRVQTSRRMPERTYRERPSIPLNRPLRTTRGHAAPSA